MNNSRFLGAVARQYPAYEMLTSQPGTQYWTVCSICWQSLLFLIEPWFHLIAMSLPWACAPHEDRCTITGHSAQAYQRSSGFFIGALRTRQKKEAGFWVLEAEQEVEMLQKLTSCGRQLSVVSAGRRMPPRVNDMVKGFSGAILVIALP